MKRAGRREFGPQMIRFLIVGALNSAIQYLVFVTLYGIADMNYLVASIAGYCLGMLNSYLLNRRWTFASGNARVLPEAVRFAIVNVVALGVNTALLFVLVATANMRPPLAQLWAIAGSVSVNFVLNKYWTFRPPAEPSRPSCARGG